MNDRRATVTNRLKQLGTPFRIDSSTIRGQLFLLKCGLVSPNWPDRIPLVQLTEDDLGEFADRVRQMPEILGLPKEQVFWVGTEMELEYLTSQIMIGLKEPGIIILFAAEYLEKNERELLETIELRSRSRIILVMERDPETAMLARDWSDPLKRRMIHQRWPSLASRRQDWRALFNEGLSRATMAAKERVPDIRRDAMQLVMETTWNPLDGAAAVIELGKLCGELTFASRQTRVVTRETVHEALRTLLLHSSHSDADKRPTLPPPSAAHASADAATGEAF